MGSATVMKGKAPLLAVIVALVALWSPDAAAARHSKAHADRASYPMKAEEFKKLIEGRIDKVRAAIDKKLDRGNVSSERKQAIHRTIDEAAKDVRVELTRAASDGTV